MYNWSTDIKKFKDKEKLTIWKLNQQINFGLGEEKIKKSLLKKYWDKLSLDPKRKKYLEFILWGKKP